MSYSPGRRIASLCTHVFVIVLFWDFVQLFSGIVNELMVTVFLFTFLEHGCLTTKVKLYLYDISVDLKPKEERKEKHMF